MSVAKAELLIAASATRSAARPARKPGWKNSARGFDQRVMELTEALGDLGAERLFLAAGLSLLDETGCAGRGHGRQGDG